MEAARHKGWTLHVADLDIDTSTLAGEMAANIIISGSQYERRLISRRTRDALAAKHARGARLGAAPALPLEVTCRVIDERANEHALVSGIAHDKLFIDGQYSIPQFIRDRLMHDQATQRRAALPSRADRRKEDRPQDQI